MHPERIYLLVDFLRHFFLKLVGLSVRNENF